ncbi:MAG: ribosome maturation factor RimP [Lautropia sp.]
MGAGLVAGARAGSGFGAGAAVPRGAAAGGDVTALIGPVLAAMGFELVDVEFAAAGLLRITIDLADGSRPIRVEDCEQVSHQLSRLFLVEDVDYARLEISSPGLDRRLSKPADFVRFAGEPVSVRLRRPVAGRRQFSGVLLSEAEALRQLQAAGRELPIVDADPGLGPAAGAAARWVLVWRDEPEAAGAGRRGAGGKRAAGARSGVKGTGVKGGAAGSRGRSRATGAAGADGAAQDLLGEGEPRLLRFTLEQVEKARLVPKLGF